MFSFAFGGSGDDPQGVLEIGVPVLGGDARECLLGAAERAGSERSFSLWRGPGALAGISSAAAGDDVEGATRRAYADLFVAARGLNLYRIWNFVPQINGVGPSGLENYRAFCLGRSESFESAFGRDFAAALPAASAVGATGANLTVVFLAGREPAIHFENPAQVPAYLYPPEHGPRPPSFSRATVAGAGERVDAFISGTSAVTGHSTVSPHDTAGQLERTLENLRHISRVCGLGDGFAAGRAHSRHFKVYLRKPGDLQAVASEMAARVLSPGDRVSYLRADICRSALNVEIEVAVRGAERI
jgi:chorismate lyase/3-hydroxybenzoate synthase